MQHIAVAPDHLFFLTGGDDGCVKVWDTGRLERNIAHRSRQTHRHANEAKITAFCFIEHTHSFISCASDGAINVVRVECIQSGGSVRYGKLRLLREYQLPKGEIAIWYRSFQDRDQLHPDYLRRIESRDTSHRSTNDENLIHVGQSCSPWHSDLLLCGPEAKLVVTGNFPWGSGSLGFTLQGSFESLGCARGCDQSIAFVSTLPKAEADGYVWQVVAARARSQYGMLRKTQCREVYRAGGSQRWAKRIRTLAS